MLSVDLHHDFGGFELNVRFEAPQSGATALFGPSGAGKSSILKAIAGLWRPQHCRIAFGDEVLTDTKQRIFVPPHKRRFALVFQDARLFPHLSVEKNLKYGWSRLARHIEGADFDHLISLLGLGHLLHRHPRSLSGGERQRVAIGRALLSRPRLMLLDEPLSALDQARRNEILSLLERLRDKDRTPMIYVSHMAEEVARLADEMVLLSHGARVAAGRAADLFARIDLFPFTGAEDPGAVLTGIVADNDPMTKLSAIALDGGALHMLVPMAPRPTGTPVRLRIPARDVLIALQKPEGISANNVLSGRITEISPHGDGEADLAIACGGTVVLARLTAGSCNRLKLRVGTDVFAVVKSVTIDSG